MGMHWVAIAFFWFWRPSSSLPGLWCPSAGGAFWLCGWLINVTVGMGASRYLLGFFLYINTLDMSLCPLLRANLHDLQDFTHNGFRSLVKLKRN